MPRLNCPHCRFVVDASEEERGHRINCPQCGRALKVPLLRPTPLVDDFPDDEDEPLSRRRPRRKAQKSGGMPTWLIAVLVIVGLNLLVCCGGGVYWFAKGFRQGFDEAIQEAMAEQPDVTVTATELLRDYQNNPVAAADKYEDNVVQVTGVVERTGKNMDGSRTVILRGDNAAGNLRVECIFWDAFGEEKAQIRRLTPGQQVTIVGTCAGQFDNVVRLDGCSLVNK